MESAEDEDTEEAPGEAEVFSGLDTVPGGGTVYVVPLEETRAVLVVTVNTLVEKDVRPSVVTATTTEEVVVQGTMVSDAEAEPGADVDSDGMDGGMIYAVPLTVVSVALVDTVERLIE